MNIPSFLSSSEKYADIQIWPHCGPLRTGSKNLQLMPPDQMSQVRVHSQEAVGTQHPGLDRNRHLPSLVTMNFLLVSGALSAPASREAQLD